MTPEEVSTQIRRRAFAGTMEDIADLIDAQAAQIAALTEKLVESEARRMYPFTVPMWDNLPDEDFTKRTFGGMEDRHGKAFFRLKARQQLKAEMPEVELDG